MCDFSNFGVTLGLLLAYEGDFGSLWGHSGVTLGSLSVSESDFGSLWGRRGTYRGHVDVILGPFWAHFGITLESFRGRFAHFGITLESLWVYECCFRVTLFRFQKTLIFPHDFNDLARASALAFAFPMPKRSQNGPKTHPNGGQNRFKLDRTGLDRTGSGRIRVGSDFGRLHVRK